MNERNVDEEQKTSRARDDSTSARRPRVVVVVCGPVVVAIPPDWKKSRKSAIARSVGHMAWRDSVTGREPRIIP